MYNATLGIDVESLTSSPMIANAYSLSAIQVEFSGNKIDIPNISAKVSALTVFEFSGWLSLSATKVFSITKLSSVLEILF